MNEQEFLARLAQTARSQTSPAIDVSARVLERLRNEPAVSTTPMALITVASLMAAVTICTVAVRAWMDWSDPLASLMNSFDVVMQ